MRWSTKQRMAFISGQLAVAGKINRLDLMEKFEISMRQASSDLQLFDRENPGTMRYDKTAKAYVSTMNDAGSLNNPAIASHGDPPQTVWLPSQGNGGSHPDWLALVKVDDMRKALAEIDAPHAPLMKFYGVESVNALIAAMEEHIARLQASLPAPPPSQFDQRVREG